MEQYKTLIGHLPIEEQLLIEQDQFRGAFETAAIGMAIVGVDGRWLKVNDSLLNITGYTKDELCQLTFHDITHPDDLQADLELATALLKGEKDNYQMEKRYFHKNGQIIWAILSVSVVRDGAGRALHFVSQITDITVTKKIVHLRLAETDRYTSRIAMELHENIAQSLASIKMYLNSSLSAKIYKDRDLAGVDEQLSSLITEVKTLTANIMPTTFLQENLRTVVEDMVLKYHMQYNLLISVDIDESLQQMSFHSSYHIFRIIESHLKLAVLRNASAFRLNIALLKMLVLEVESDGQLSALCVSQEELLLGDIKTRTEIIEESLRNKPEAPLAQKSPVEK